MRGRITLTFGVVALSAVVACGPDGDPDNNQAEANNSSQCTGKCDADTTLLAELEGREDPIADWIRARLEADGVLNAGYVDILNEINAELGCAEEDALTFVISDPLITRDQPFPRSVSVACADDTQNRFKLFMSMPNGTAEGDFDETDIELFAWDDEAKVYRFYKTEMDAEGNLEVLVEPSECASCHMGPADLMQVDATGTPMMPIMNELTEPWAHWNAEPSFRSQDFSVPAGTEGMPIYAALTSNGRLGAASQLEQIIRDAQARVVSARYGVRRDDATVAQAMGLLRPIFCEEQVNYVSERGDSGLISMGIVLDDNIRELYGKIDATNWPYPWFYNQTNSLRFEVASRAGDRLSMVPVRGDIDRAVELKLRRAIGAEKLLQVRALDWKRPVFSQFRCDLWKQARERFRLEPPELEGSNSDALPVLVDEILRVNDVPIASPAEGELIVLDHASEESVATLEQMLLAGDVADAGCDTGDPSAPCECGERGVCVADLNEFAQIIQTHINAIEEQGRESVRDQSQETICEAMARFENQPFIEAGGACAAAD